MNLYKLGWSDLFQIEEGEKVNLSRVIAVHRSHLRAITVNGEVNIHYSGGYTEPVAVGDWIIMTPPFVDEQNQPAALIKQLVPRKSKISRVAAGAHVEEQVIAANIDNVFIVTSVNQDLNVNRLKRFILLVKEGGAKPIVILSKSDLTEDVYKIINSLSEQLGGDIAIIPTSSLNKSGIENVLSLMPEGSTSVFVGSSGVGKSSMVNFLLGKDIQVVKEIREDDAKGRHATTARQMFFIANGGMIIDTPGIREVSVFGSEDSLAETFSDVDSLLLKCKFSDCTHTSEPGCAILDALDSGELEQKQWDNFLKLQKEIAFNNRKMDKVEMSNSKKKWKQIHLDYKARKKFEGK